MSLSKYALLIMNVPCAHINLPCLIDDSTSATGAPQINAIPIYLLGPYSQAVV